MMMMMMIYIWSHFGKDVDLLNQKVFPEHLLCARHCSNRPRVARGSQATCRACCCLTFSSSIVRPRYLHGRISHSHLIPCSPLHLFSHEYQGITAELTELQTLLGRDIKSFTTSPHPLPSTQPGGSLGFTLPTFHRPLTDPGLPGRCGFH